MSRVEDAAAALNVTLYQSGQEMLWRGLVWRVVGIQVSWLDDNRLFWSCSHYILREKHGTVTIACLIDVHFGHAMIDTPDPGAKGV